jgi:quercetin dioxygenase-like cupin family protein
MRSFHVRKQPFVLMATSIGATLIAIVAYAALPPRDVGPDRIPLGNAPGTTTLAGQTPINVLSVDAFLRAMSQEQGTNGVLQLLHFNPGQSTLWHTHPGPNIVLVVGGDLTLTDERCRVTKYYDGQGFATGLQKHLAVAGPHGADFYTFYLLPGRADVLRTPPSGESANPPRCAEK